MAAAVETTWRASSPESVDADLAALWRDAGQQGAVSRALMSNLVVMSPHREFPAVEEIARKHPARTILLSYAAEITEARAPEDVRIGLHTFGEGPARYGLEFIAVHTSCAGDALPSIVRRLTVGSVPTSVWWTSDLSSATRPDAVSAIGRQLVYDSARWRDVNAGLRASAALLDRPQAPDLADLNWRRMAPLRDAVVHALRGDSQPSTGSISAARVTHAPGAEAAAWLVAGWLRARLDVAATVDDQTENDENILTVAIETDGRLLCEAAMTAHHVHVTSNRPAFVVPVPAESESEAVAAELLALAPDRGLCDALRALAGGAFGPRPRA